MQQEFLFYGFLLLPLYHIFTFVVLVRNIQWMHPKIWDNLNIKDYEASISICIPARNEEASIGNCLTSIIKATEAKPVPIYVLDDHSEDTTAQIVSSLAKFHPSIHLVNGIQLPEGWRGKNWACQQLANQVSTDYILFLDADVSITENLLPRISHSFRQNSAVNMISFWPEQQLQDKQQFVVIPWVYRALLTHLPSVYQFKKPIWMPTYFYAKLKYLFAAANGQCICFKRQAYLAIGGHDSVKNEIVEDICLSKVMLKKGYATKILSGKDSISCGMYATDEQMFEGFRKNFFVGFGKNIPLFVFAALFHWTMFLLPILLLFFPPFQLIALYSLTIAIATDMLLKHHFGWPKWTAFIHPLGVFWFTKLAFRCVLDHLTNTPTNWKGRKL